MAQPLFDEHPIEEYLRESGEMDELMPGGAPDFLLERMNANNQMCHEKWMPPPMLKALQAVLSATQHLSDTTSPFVERFKYDVISSSLLSSSLSPTYPTGRRSTSPHIPGRLNDNSRPSSVDYDQPTENTPSSSAAQPDPSAIASEAQYWVTVFLMSAILALFSSGYHTLAVIFLLPTLCYVHICNLDVQSRPDMSSSLESLNDLIAAGNVWDSVVQEAIVAIENDEQSMLYSPATPGSPSSSLRVALHSSLHTTQTQCDNIRQLFSALTSSSELSQLSEMYAPPSPMRSSFTTDTSFDNPRPSSFPSSYRVRTISVPTQPSNKRSTWNGSYAALALAGSPTKQVLKRREKRRSDLSALLGTPSPTKSSSAPVTPSIAPALSGVQEEEDSLEVSEPIADRFGVAALDLQRKRKSRGMEAFGIQPINYSGNSSPRPAVSAPSTVSSASRFTMMQATRHPLSLFALQHALQNALSSRRYACSHLLALRFADEDDEGYWEDVRSVIGLLTSTLADASSRLTEALEDAEKKQLSDETADSLPLEGHADKSERTLDAKISFAPMPSHLSRFATHVEAISSALSDARHHLEQCVASLREESSNRLDTGTSPGSRSASPSPADPTEPASLQAYERLRRELGLALRECERGRERLLDLTAARVPQPDSDDADVGLDDLPALGHDGGSDDSEKADSRSDDGDARGGFLATPAADLGDGEGDDATAHLLLTASSAHLPPAGIEQVFEADAGGVLFARERSKLSREERIQLVKARRESGGGLGLAFPPRELAPAAGRERWGPGGEVVQELKDVIWKVGERRRRMTTDGQRHDVDPDALLSPSDVS